MQQEYRMGVWYDPQAEVAHKVFEYRTKFPWLVDRAFWQGYSKRAMESKADNEGNNETDFLNKLIREFIPKRIKSLFRNPSLSKLIQFLSLLIFIGVVGAGYLYAYPRY
jgi:hypothetical protein